MPELVFSVVCSRAIVDRLTNGLSIIDVVDGIAINNDAEQLADNKASTIALNPPLTIVQLWARENASSDETFTNRILVIAPDRKKLSQPGMQLSFHGKLNIRSIMTLPSIPAKGSGLYRIVSQEKVKGKNGSDRWQTRAEVPINIEIIEQRTEAPAESNDFFPTEP